MKSEQLRESFLEFFESKAHKILPSASLIPVGDPSLLLLNAGMVPFKPIFQGEVKPDYPRVTTSQKCVRVIDIEKVGKTVRHLTFFEMLGNFSFGDYFKELAISFAWEFLTEQMRLPKDKLWVSIYEEDEEAYNIWSRELGIPSSRIYRFGKEDNFWAAGPTGPCGPDSEIFMDLGEEFGCGKKDCQPGCDCDRYIELWNLVFMQYYRNEKGELNPLPKKNIDTGMGLERLAMIKQKVSSPYQTDLFKPIIDYLLELLGITKGKNKEADLSLRIIADHIRAATFLISDGVSPSNLGRGYVLRRLIRRAERLGKELGQERPFLYKLVPTVVRTISEAYPEVKEAEEWTFKMIETEEARFQETLQSGSEMLEGLLEKLKKEGKKELAGSEVFKLYDTYGFPKELTEDIARERGFSLNEKGFIKAMEKQREQARKTKEEEEVEIDIKLYENLSKELPKIKFVGYLSTSSTSKILSIIKEGKLEQMAREGEEVEIILNPTPFYGEMGGQVGDKGRMIKSIEGKEEVVVTETKRPLKGIIVQHCQIKKGSFKVGEEVLSFVAKMRRLAISRHHTATHLLQASLRKVLGKQVRQSGSLVDEARLRFDFSYPRALTKEELKEVEEILNQKILENIPVETYETKIDKAKAEGAIALFGEKYEEIVRVVKVGEFSKELCGGCHVRFSGEIGLCKIVNEESIGAGLRRIEALAGSHAYEYLSKQVDTLGELSKKLKVRFDSVIPRVDKILETTQEKEQDIIKLRKRLIELDAKSLAKRALTINNIRAVITKVKDLNLEELRVLGDLIKERLSSGIVILASVSLGKVTFVGMATSDLKERGVDLGWLLREVAKVTSGSGGGRWDMAQAGGKDYKMLDKALKKAEKLIKLKVKSERG